MISVVIEVVKIKKIEGVSVTMDIEKAFDLIDHNFLFSALKKYGFGKNFILWVKILLRDQTFCVIQGDTTTKYFSIGRDAKHGDPVSAFLFFWALEISFLLIIETWDWKNGNL